MERQISLVSYSQTYTIRPGHQVIPPMNVISKWKPVGAIRAIKKLVFGYKKLLCRKMWNKSPSFHFIMVLPFHKKLYVHQPPLNIGHNF